MTNFVEQSLAVHRGGELHWVGNGFPVRSIFSYDDLGQQLSPFLLLDYAAPHYFSPGSERRGVEAHPHRGFETVTIAYQGELEHRDSGGGGGVIGPGDVQWMTASSGIVHEELHTRKFVESGGMFEMVQLWVNLPARFKSAPTGYQTLTSATIPQVKLEGGVGECRIFAGELMGTLGVAKTFTAINLWDLQLSAKKLVQLPLPSRHSRAMLVLSGAIVAAGQQVQAGELLVVSGDNDTVEFTPQVATRALILTGEPINEPIVGRGPFVMNSEEEIRQAYQDYRLGKFGDIVSG